MRTIVHTQHGATQRADRHPTSELAAGIDAAVQRGRNASSAKTEYRNANMVKRFDDFLRTRESDLDGLRRLALHSDASDPIVPLVSVIAFRLSLFDVKPSAAKTYMSQLRAGLVADNWDISAVKGDGCGQRSILCRLQHLHERQWVAGGQRLDPKPMRPWTVEDLSRLVADVDALGDETNASTLWRCSTKAFILVSWFAACRIFEMVLMRHDWLRPTRDGFEIVFPPGLKHQRDEMRTLITPTRNTALCPVTALRDWLDAAASAGVPAGPNDRVFIEVSAADPDASRCDGRAVFAGRAWVDRLDELVNTKDWRPGRPTAERAACALGLVNEMHRKPIKALLFRAGLTARTHERIGPHGARSGVSLALHEAGTSDYEIARLLRHDNSATLDPYLQPRFLPTLDLATILGTAPNAEEAKRAISQVTKHLH